MSRAPAPSFPCMSVRPQLPLLVTRRPCTRQDFIAPPPSVCPPLPAPCAAAAPPPRSLFRRPYIRRCPDPCGDAADPPPRALFHLTAIWPPPPLALCSRRLFRCTSVHPPPALLRAPPPLPLSQSFVLGYVLTSALPLFLAPPLPIRPDLSS